MTSCIRIGAVVLGVAWLAGCQRSSPGVSDGSPPRTLTFNADIAPIVSNRCAPCHRPGEPVPFSLVDYDDVRAHAQDIASATRNRRMPPWLPEAGYGEFSNERRLTDSEIAVIQQWVAEGTIEGDPAARPSPRQWPVGWQLREPDLVLRMPESYVLPAAGSDVFRNFVIPVPLSGTRYVRAMELRPGNPRLVHHASIGVDRMRLSRGIDRADTEPGFAAMPDDQVQNMFGWTPGKTPFLETPDSAWPLDKGSDLILQLHLLPSGKPEVVDATIGVFFSDTPPSRVPILIKLESRTIDIPAGRSDYIVEDTYSLPVDVDVLNVYPHAHYLARDIKGFATLPDGTVKWLIWIKAWDFRWQDQYRYAAPLFLPKGATLTMRFTYDNSAANPNNPHRPPQRVKWGAHSSDEMAVLWLETLPRRSDDASMLLRDYTQRGFQADLAGAQFQVAVEPGDAAAHNRLATKYLQVGRLDEATSQLQEALRLNPDDAEAHSNLGSIFQTQGRLTDAMQHLRRAVRLAPGNDRVRFNLGNALRAAGSVDAAIQEFNRAVAISPDNADAHFNLGLALGSQGKLGQAIAHFRRVLEINPQNADAYLNLGIALRLSDQRAAALDSVTEALRLRPDFEGARKELSLLQQPAGVKRSP
jgi:Tfp pilus assembly protein PilF